MGRNWDLLADCMVIDLNYGPVGAISQHDATLGGRRIQPLGRHINQPALECGGCNHQLALPVLGLLGRDTGPVEYAISVLIFNDRYDTTPVRSL